MTADDLDDMAALLGDSIVMRYYPAPKNRDDAAAWIAWNQRNYADYGYGLLVIETHAGAFVGDCGLSWQQVNGTRKLEVGFRVRAGDQGIGYATEAAAACLDYARQRTDATELVAIVHPENHASRRVAEKIGLRHVEDDHGGTIPVRTVLAMTL